MNTPDEFAAASGCVLSTSADGTVTEVLPEPPAPPDHSVRTHAKISPSKLNYLDPAVGGCWGFESSGDTTAAAEEGTAHHELLDAEIVSWLTSGKGTLEGHLFARRAAIKWTEEDDHLYRYCARAIEKFLAHKPEVFNEIKIAIHDGAGIEITYGHFDLLIIVGKKVGILVDWKFGIIPVVPADSNRQGFAYAVGVLQKWPLLERLGIMFVQPKLNWTSHFVIHRKDLAKYVDIIDGIITRKELIEEDYEKGLVRLEELNPGTACRYCTRTSNCVAFIRQFAIAAPRLGALPLPAGLDLDAIDTPEKAALAVTWVDFLADKLPELRKKALEVADRHGGSISLPLPDGTVLVYDTKERGFDRSLGETPLVMDALKEWVTPEELLGIATLSYGKLEDLAATRLADEQDITKKRAKEVIESHLSSLGLLSRPDGKIRFLSLRKEAKNKQKQIKS